LRESEISIIKKLVGMKCQTYDINYHGFVQSFLAISHSVRANTDLSVVSGEENLSPNQS